MKFQFTIRDLLLIIVIAALAAGWWIDHQRINRLTVQKWEYRTGSLQDSNSLTANGSEGWEACGVVFNTRYNNAEVLFKRPLR